MQRRLLPLLALVCLSVVVSADFADNIYDGSLTPFSYAELQAEMTPATPFAGSNPVFLAPESLVETNAAAVARAQALARAQAAARAQAGSPVAFPFQQPPLPADLALQGRAASPYDGMAFAQNEMLQRLASTVDAAVANAPGQYRDMAPLGLVEANSMIRGVNPMDSMPLVAPGTPAALPQTGMPSAEEMTRDPTEAQTISASATEPINTGMRMKQISSSVSAPPPALPSSSIMSGLSSSSAPALPSTSSGSMVSSSSQLPSISSALSSLGSPSSTSAAASVASASASASRSGSGSSSVTPISDSKPKPRHRCIPKGNNACVVDIDPKTVEWKVVTVPRGANEGSQVEDLKSQSRALSQQSKSGSSSQAALVGESAYQQEYSENPTIAAAQKAFYEKQDELMKEKRWIADVKRIIDEYNIKIRNVQRHTTIEEMELNKSRKNIVNMIKAEKAKKLEGELQAALESLKKLEMTSQALNNKMGELTQTKQGLQTTISKIQKVIGGAKSSGALLETQAVVTDSHLNAQQDANEGAKQLFASLIQLVSKAQQKTTDKEAALRAAYEEHHAPKRSQVPMHTHGTHLRALRDREARAHANEAMVDLAEIDSKAHSIADKYAAEENKRMHTNFPLHTLALKDMRKANDDDLFLDF